MTFWIIVSLLALAVAGLLALALLGRCAGSAPAAAYDLQVYRDQLREVDRDLGRGVIGEADAERIRAEVSRRILAADAQARAEAADPGQSRALSVVLAVAVAAILVGGSLAIYLELGQPGQSDLPLRFRIELSDELRQARPAQDAAEARMPASEAPEIEADYAALLEQLRAKVAGLPDDLQGHVLLARHEANAGNFAAAHRAQARVIELMGSAAGPEEYLELAELMILATAGYVSPDAEAALRKVLDTDPVNGPALYYWGLMQAQIGRPDLAFETWDRTLRHSPPDAPWLVPIRAQIEEMAWRAGVEFDPPAPAMAATAQPGPSQADVAAAGEMSEADRQEMIRGMVDRLSDRLAAEGGNAEDWSRLIAALGVLGDADRAQQALADARTAHAGDDAALAAIDAAARRAGLIRVILDAFPEFAAACLPGRALIGLDLGDKTIGVAVSDRIGAVATPLETVRRRKFTLDADRLLQIVAAREAGGILLGLPRNMDGSEGPRCQSTRAFARNLARLTDLPIGFWDERLSTVAAERALLEADTSRKRRAEVIDHVAAGYILQGALDRMRHMRTEARP